MVDFLHILHAHNRVLMVVLALVCIVKLSMNLIRSTAYGKTDAMLLRLFAIVFTIQFAVGLVLLVNVGSSCGWDMKQMHLQVEHATIMIIALGLSHATASVRRKDPAVRSRKALIFVTASLVLIVVGVARLKGFDFWFTM